MNHYVFEYKKEPASFGSNPVYLVQYMVFRNRKNSEKYMMIKIGNQTSRVVLEVKLEFLQFDSSNQKLSKTHYVFTDLHMGGYEKTVPYEIIRVRETCDSVECHVLHVKAEDGIWQAGSWQSTETDHDDNQSLEVVANDYDEFKFPVLITLRLIFLYVLIMIMIMFFGLF
jgi:hypothetical protein